MSLTFEIEKEWQSITTKPLGIHETTFLKPQSECKNWCQHSELMMELLSIQVSMHLIHGAQEPLCTQESADQWCSHTYKHLNHTVH